jgi:hypothetical protein
MFFSNIIFFFCCQVVIGGGQDAMNVTMTDRRAGKFEAKFFHKVNYPLCLLASCGMYFLHAYYIVTVTV